MNFLSGSGAEVCFAICRRGDGVSDERVERLCSGSGERTGRRARVTGRNYLEEVP